MNDSKEKLFHFSSFKCFKHYYLYFICDTTATSLANCLHIKGLWQSKKQLFLPLNIVLHRLFGEETGLFADSTSLKVCHNKRINPHKLFEGIASRAVSAMGWFYGLKLHIIIHSRGEIISLKITRANVDDRTPLKQMAKGLTGKCYADKGYIGKNIWQKGLHLITGIRRNMRNKRMLQVDKLLLKSQFLIKRVFGQLKRGMNIDHSSSANQSMQ